MFFKGAAAGPGVSGQGRIRVGTSGWQYPHWRGPFYPPGLPPSDWFAFYAERFGSVEINASFYRRPTQKAVARWKSAAPDGFVFAVKAHRGITHFKKLKNAGQAVADFLEAVSGLGKALGPILFQLPPHWRFDVARLRDFLAELPAGQRFAFELRDPSWINDAALALLAEAKAAFCVYDLAGFRSPVAVTAPFAYIRLHGPGAAYQGRYGQAGLAFWAQIANDWAGQGCDVYCYFDNDQGGFAAMDAALLAAMLESKA